MHPIIRGTCGGILGAVLAIAFSCRDRFAWIIVLGHEPEQFPATMTEVAIVGCLAGAFFGFICGLLQGRAKGGWKQPLAWACLASFLLVGFLLNAYLPVNRVRE